MLQFFETYKGKRKFFNQRNIGPHEVTGGVNRYIDDELEKTLKIMKNRGYLKNTILMIFSDHGNHLNVGVRYSQSGDAELFNPFFFMITSEDVDEEYRENLVENRDRLVTHFDIFKTATGFIGLDSWKFMPKEKIYDLFREVVDENRTCKKALILKEKECRCAPNNYY